MQSWDPYLADPSHCYHNQLRDDIGKVRPLFSCETEIDAKDLDGETPLQKAAQWNDLLTAKGLIKNGAEIDVKSTFMQETALHLAAEHGCVEMVKFLVENRATVEVKNFVGKTPFYVAAEGNHLEVVAFLKEKGADMNAKDCDEETALHVAVRRNHLEIVKFLVENGADIQVENFVGKTALYIATEENHLEIVTFLKEKGADIEAKDCDGQTALHVAVKWGHLEIITFLIKNGADIYAQNDKGITPLQRALRKKGKRIGRGVLLAVLLKNLNAEEPTGVSAKKFASDFWDACQREIGALHSIHPILIESVWKEDGEKLMSLSRNKEVMRKVFRKNFLKKYPNLGPFIRNQLREAGLKRIYVDFILRSFYEGQKRIQGIPLWSFKKQLELLKPGEEGVDPQQLERTLSKELLEKILQYLPRDFLLRVIRKEKNENEIEAFLFA